MRAKKPCYPVLAQIPETLVAYPPKCGHVLTSRLPPHPVGRSFRPGAKGVRRPCCARAACDLPKESAAVSPKHHGRFTLMKALIAILFLASNIGALAQNSPTPTPTVRSEPIKIALQTYSDDDQDFTLLQLYKRVLGENPNVQIVDDKAQANMGVGLVALETTFGGVAWSMVLIQYNSDRKPILRGHWLYTSSSHELIKEVRKHAKELSDNYLK